MLVSAVYMSHNRKGKRQIDYVEGHPVLKVIPRTYYNLFSITRFRWFWIGATLSSIGDAMSEISIIWLAIELAPHNQGTVIAFSSAAYLIPGVVSGTLLGKILDRVNSRLLILVDCYSRFGFLAAVAVFRLVGYLPLWLYIVLLAFAAVTRPIGQAGERVFLRDLIPQTEFFSANSMLSISVQGATIIGPALAGILIALMGAANVIALDAISFAVFGLVLWLLPKSSSIADFSASPTSSSVASLRQLLQLRVIVGLFLLTFLFHLLYGPLVVALPLYTESLAQPMKASGAAILGLLWSGFGIGTLLGGFFAGLRRSLASYTTAAIIVGLWGVAVVMIAATPFIPVAVVAMTIGGFVYAPYASITTTIMQHQSPSNWLARISSYWSAMTSVASPLGTIAAGVVMPLIGARPALLESGVVTILIACVALCSTRLVHNKRKEGLT